MNKFLGIAVVFSFLHSATWAATWAATSVRADESDRAAEELMLTEPDAEAPSRLSLVPAAGFSLAQPKELNALLMKNTLNGDSIAGELMGASSLQLSASYALGSYVAVGLRLEYAQAQTSRKVTFDDVSMGMDDELSWLVPFATLEFGIPVSHRVRSGVAGGAGLPIFYHLGIRQTADLGGKHQEGEVSYSARPFTAYAAVFTEFEVSKHASLRAEAGYRFLNASSMTASAAGSDAMSGVSAGSVLRDASGAAVPVDASSPFFGAGLCFQL